MNRHNVRTTHGRKNGYIYTIPAATPPVALVRQYEAPPLLHVHALGVPYVRLEPPATDPGAKKKKKTFVLTEARPPLDLFLMRVDDRPDP